MMVQLRVEKRGEEAVMFTVLFLFNTASQSEVILSPHPVPQGLLTQQRVRAKLPPSLWEV